METIASNAVAEHYGTAPNKNSADYDRNETGVALMGVAENETGVAPVRVASEMSAQPISGVAGEMADAAETGFITCARTARISKTAGSGYVFSTLDECRSGASAVGSVAWDGREGPCPTLEIYPGLVRLTAPDFNRREKSADRAQTRPVFLSETEDAGENSTGIIREFSRKSRARLVAAMAELDLAPLLLQDGDPAMITLTYPGEWQSVAPNGAVVKEHLKTFFKRYERAWGSAWMGVWKLEYQSRGAPHYHLLMVPPSGLAGAERRADFDDRMLYWELTGDGNKPRWRSAVGDGLPFNKWLSAVWADVVGHKDPDEFARHLSAGTAVDYSEGSRARDPKRAAVYFGKHGTFADKEYQHKVPECWEKSGKSVGRFWGYRGLKKIAGAASLTMDEMLFLGRVLRKYGTRTRVYDPETGRHYTRPVLRRVWVARKTRLADGSWKPSVDELGLPLLDDEGLPVPAVKMRRSTTRARRMTGKNDTGFLLVNDGPAMARTLARALETCLGSPEKMPVGMRGKISMRNH